MLAAEARAVQQREENFKLFYEEIDRKEAKKHKAREKEEEETKQFEQMAATTEQLNKFNEMLDNYDTCTVHTLMENRDALDRLNHDLRRMEENAYALSDGRRVFKTADGRRVFDEQGGEVAASTVDPQMIGDHHTRWEAYKAGKDAETKLEAERHDLLEFQAKVDDARDRASKSNITKKELDDLEAGLTASAPSIVRQQLGLTLPEAGDMAKVRSDCLAPTQLEALSDNLTRRSQIQPAPM